MKIVPTEFREHEELLDNDNPSVEESSSDEDLFSLNSFTSSDNSSNSETEQLTDGTYPTRVPTARQLPGSIPWNAITL